jgi:DNA-binding transcriptional LysR family regulator
MDRLTSLAVFVRVVDSGGFAAASRRLGLSTTMVSSHVQALEGRLGVRLLNRTTRRVSLTEAGKGYYQRCTRILADLDDADRMAMALDAVPRGTLRLYAGTHIVPFIAPMIAEFLALHPQIAIDLTMGERMVDIVEEGYDLAIRPTPPPDSSLIVRHLVSWRPMLCCAPAYLETHERPLQPSDLVRHNCLRYAFFPTGDEWRFTGPAGEPVAVRVSGNLLTNSAEVLRRVALGGQGLFLAPTFIAAEDLGPAGWSACWTATTRSSSPSMPSIPTATISRPRSGASSTSWRNASSSTDAG